MLTITEKTDLMNPITIKFWAQAETSSSLGPANLVFCINPQKAASEKRNLDSLGRLL